MKDMENPLQSSMNLLQGNNDASQKRSATLKQENL
jgi:hypothetical protein